MSIKLKPIGNLVGEINRQFQQNPTIDDNWLVAQDVAKDFGAIAINVGGTNSAGDQASWARSSMTDAWLEIYESKKYYLVDPFIAALTDGLSEVMTDTGTLRRSNPAFELNHDLKSHGYVSLYANMFGNINTKYRSIVTFCFGCSLAEINATIGFDRLKIVQAIIAANIPSPNAGNNAGQIIVQANALSVKERAILSWLANGLRNDQIAFKMDIAEVTVRKHLLSLRKKLGAATREQAIAIAVRDGWVSL